MKKYRYPHFIFGKLFVLIIFILGSIYLSPWQKINWGKIQFMPSQTITVTGTAKTQETSQIARFTAGVSSVQDDKQRAVDEVNQKVRTLIESIKDFGVEDKDIKTQNLNIYQDQEQYYEDNRRKTRPGQWRISNSVEITLRDAEKTSRLTNLLTASGATNVYGPRFSLDDTQEAEEGLLGEAIENARKKAESIAQSSKRKLGKMINVTEGYQSVSVFRGLEGIGAGGGAPVEPGSQTVSKSVTVTFELK